MSSHVKEVEPVKKTKRVKRLAKKSTTTPTAGVAIRDTHGVSVLKKKAPAKADRSKGIEIIFDVALSEATKLKEATKKSKKDYHISQASGSSDGTAFESGVPDEQQRKTSGIDKGTGTKPRVHDVPAYDSESENESWGDSEDDNDDDSDDDSKGDDDKADSDDDEEDDDLYKDVDMRSLGAEQEQERIGDEEMTDADQNVSQNKALLTQAPSLFTVPETAIPETTTVHTTTVPPAISMITHLPQLTTPSPAPITVPTITSIPALLDFSSLFGFDERMSTLETELSLLKQADISAQVLESKSVKDIINDEVKSLLPLILPKEVSDFATPMIQSTITESLENVILAKSSCQPQSTYKVAASLTEFELKKIMLDKLEKRSREDKDNDEDPPAGPDQALKKKKTSKDAEPSRGFKSKESKSSSSKGFTITDMPHKIMDDDSGNTKDHPNVEKRLGIFGLKKIGHEYPFNHSKPLPLIEVQGHQVVPVDYFFKNDLEYLKGGSSSTKYITSTTKTKAAKYDNIEGIKDMVRTLWSPVRIHVLLVPEGIGDGLLDKEKMETEMELALEHTQQGSSNEVSVSTEGVEELKRNVKIKGEKKAALL
ncbi:hypothetical protein Tco_0246103 [Tanacetum coccineum]